MDRLTWIYKIPRVSHAYVNGVNEFIACAVENLRKKQIEHGKEDRITCPYRDCYNLKKYPNIDTVREHLFLRGFMEDYTKWICHGQGIHTSKTETSSKIYETYGDSMPRNEENDPENDRVEEMIQDVEKILVHQPEVLENLVDDSKKPLYHGCNVQFTRLSTTLKLCKLKVKNGWSDKSFTEMLKHLAEMLPAKNELPTSTYEAKKILCPMGMNVKKIHACPNDCVVFRKEHEHLHTCPKCGASRYKRDGNNSSINDKRPPVKVLRYLPIVERFRRLFPNSNDTKLVRWHVEGRKSDGMLRHPADSPQWRTIDEAGNNIDVYLQPLIEDLKLLWDQGYTIKGAKACPIYEDATIDLRLKNCKKNVYMGHRTFLPLTHPYRKRKNDFDGTIKTRVAHFPLTGKEVFERVKDIDVVLGKLIIGTLLNIPGKTNDGMKARLDLQELGVRAELAPQQSGKRAYLPPACYTLSRKDKISFCECLSSVKVPSGYSSNPKNLVSMKDLKFLGLKSHDCHILMQHLLPLTIRGILPWHVRVVITKLCFFFNVICSKVIDPLTLDKLQADIIVTLCEFEMYFLHSFFDIMVHLVTHLVREIKICGPLYVHQMYPFKRFLCILKAYVRNRRHPKASIVEGYSVEETIEFCTDYLASTDPVGIPRSRHEGRLDGQGTVGHKMITLGAEMLDRSHLFVLQHMTEVNPYLQEHILEIR
ncbi:uncharacterized protein LOC141659793 [Apium graveolens]|uniref:uncharacterized protein LOC141659793 n=1 Tax=Apium graveolens TaxID=4045 RepID=UPI003D7A676C